MWGRPTEMATTIGTSWTSKKVDLLLKSTSIIKKSQTPKKTMISTYSMTLIPYFSGV